MVGTQNFQKKKKIKYFFEEIFLESSKHSI